ncbi:thiamine pyrophosphate-dependent enzyme [Brevibacterium luteolum]|uniref:thiamine pyrophosphate-dependent enzyme n=1 Tax=Brevibacterium luteolum TaxID=199591 RepID=UPI0021AF16DC|nr:thiamine pyrophosphate-dependent enzyme [Brevibacterium luteolum]MCT1829068.1 thiamine pyrophosphate-binding protein [Brevibacterium luteolum]
MTQETTLAAATTASATEKRFHNGGLAVVAALAAHGVDMIFGIPGTHNLEFYRHLPDFGIRAITPRHEQGAGYGADGYFLVSGKPGVVITTSGPGLTNVITAAATAYAESRPMLILSPGVPIGLERADIGMLHETKDSSGALSHLLVSSRRTRTAEGAAQAVADAFALFASERPGPVHIEVPLDVLEGQWWGAVPAPQAPRRPVLDMDMVATAAEALAGSRTPLIVAGGGARRAAAEVRALAEALDAPVVTTANGKGVLDETHPLSLGANVRFPAVQRASAEADVLLVLGSELADSDLWGGRIGTDGDSAADGAEAGAGSTAAQTVIRCDIDPDQLNKNLRGNIHAFADCTDFLTALLEHEALHGAGERDGQNRVTALTEAYQADFDFASTNVHLHEVITAAAGADVIIAGDSSQITYDGTVHALTAHTPDQLLYMPGFATLGYGIPAAIGAKLAAPPRPVVCVVGDGAAMFSIQEIVTAVELRLPIPFVIVDNGGYAEIEHQMEDRDMDPYAVRLHRPDFAALGESMGARGVTISADAIDTELAEAIRTTLAGDRPAVIRITLPGA